jgi:restriction system protein
MAGTGHSIAILKTALASLPGVSQAANAPFLFMGVIIAATCLVAGSYFLKLALRRHRRRQWFARQKSMQALRSMSWQEFETLTGEAFRQQGYSVRETGSGADGGIDLILHKGGRKYLVQCKHYRKHSVGAPVIRELAGVAVRERAHGIIVVTIGTYTHAARAFAKGLPVRLIDGPSLLSMIKATPS